MWPALGADRGSEPISVREYLHPPPPCPTQVLPFHRSLRDRKCVFLAQLHPVTAGEILVGAGITRPDFPRRRCEESRRGCQLCKQATARVPFRLPPMASREGCPGLGGDPGPSLLLWIPHPEAAMSPAADRGQRRFPDCGERGHPGPEGQRPGGHTPCDHCTCQFAEALSLKVSVWTSPGREDPAGVGGPKVMAPVGEASLWSSPASRLAPAPALSLALVCRILRLASCQGRCALSVQVLADNSHVS